MAHPINYVEGDQKYLSTLRKCQHSVFKPYFVRDSEPNTACGICTQPKILSKPVPQRVLKEVDKEFPVEEDLIVVQPVIEDEDQPDLEDPQELGVINETGELEEVEAD